MVLLRECNKKDDGVPYNIRVKMMDQVLLFSNALRISGGV